MNTPELEARIDQRQRQKRQDKLTLPAVAAYLLRWWLWP
jgi:hypothetical protein